MERFSLSVDQAFNVLTRLSSEREQKLRVMAADLIRTRALPI